MSRPENAILCPVGDCDHWVDPTHIGSDIADREMRLHVVASHADAPPCHRCGMAVYDHLKNARGHRWERHQLRKSAVAGLPPGAVQSNAVALAETPEPVGEYRFTGTATAFRAWCAANLNGGRR